MVIETKKDMVVVNSPGDMGLNRIEQKKNVHITDPKNLE